LAKYKVEGNLKIIVTYDRKKTAIRYEKTMKEQGWRK